MKPRTRCGEGGRQRSAGSGASAGEAPRSGRCRRVGSILDRVHRRFDVGLWHRLEHVVSPFPGWRGVLEQEPPSPGELERRAVQVTERAQPCLLVSLCGVPDDLGQEPRTARPRRPGPSPRGYGAGRRAWRSGAARASAPGQPAARAARSGPGGVGVLRKALGDARPDRPRTNGVQPLEAADQLGR